MKFGLVARADDRGLGIQTWEIARHLRPDRVLVVRMPADQYRLVSDDFDRYVQLGVPVVIVDAASMGDPAAVAPWLAGLDVVYSAETFYDWRFCDIARAEGVRTVLHCNPEFWKHWQQQPNPEPWPDVIWTPTHWQLNHVNMPVVDRVVPMPVPTDRWPDVERVERAPGPLRVLHVAGHMAMADRNGTRALFRTLRHTTERMHVTVTTQARSLHYPSKRARGVTYESVIGNQRDYWSLYEQQDVIVLPRRYGGLCLPANEACGAGLAVVMPDVEPNHWWPIVGVRAEQSGPIEVPLGWIDTFDADVHELAQALDSLARSNLTAARDRSLLWAKEHSWDALEDEWRAALADACR